MAGSHPSIFDQIKSEYRVPAGDYKRLCRLYAQKVTKFTAKYSIFSSSSLTDKKTPKHNTSPHIVMCFVYQPPSAAPFVHLFSL